MHFHYRGHALAIIFPRTRPGENFEKINKGKGAYRIVDVSLFQHPRINVDVSDNGPKLLPRRCLEKVAPSGQSTRFLQHVVS